MVYVIDSLQPVTLYAVSVSCVGQHGDWSDWSKECSGMTSESGKPNDNYIKSQILTEINDHNNVYIIIYIHYII